MFIFIGIIKLYWIFTTGSQNVNIKNRDLLVYQKLNFGLEPTLRKVLQETRVHRNNTILFFFSFGTITSSRCYNKSNFLHLVVKVHCLYSGWEWGKKKLPTKA